MRTIKFVLTATAMFAGVAFTAQAEDRCGPSYTIQPGDSLGKVAKRCGQNVSDILAANPEIRDPSRLSVGQSIDMPGAAPVQEIFDPVETTLNGRIVNGRWCALIETPEGDVYGLASPNIAFRSGIAVKVTGRVVGGKECRQERMIAVSELSEAAVK